MQHVLQYKCCKACHDQTLRAAAGNRAAARSIFWLAKDITPRIQKNAPISC